jgi:cytochrome c oxidase subunit 3|tara:strand:- start:1211 stop:1867 length:657 start_codon:yes stop_codon:yes gene_type:complete
MSHDKSSPDFLYHHFYDVNQQYETSKLGMWAFILTEVLTFGALFVAYTIYRAWNPDMFINANLLLDVNKGLLNTIVLIGSSLTMALAIWAIQLKKKKLSLVMLFVTFICAAIFLGIKYLEYEHKFHLGQLPGEYYSYMGPEIAHMNNPHIFFSIYFIMTGLHGLHVAIGMGLIAWLMVLTARDKLHSAYYTPMELVGIFWHLVDIIWIFLFPLFYLIG